MIQHTYIIYSKPFLNKVGSFKSLFLNILDNIINNISFISIRFQYTQSYIVFNSCIIHNDTSI